MPRRYANIPQAEGSGLAACLGTPLVVLVQYSHAPNRGCPHFQLISSSELQVDVFLTHEKNLSA